MEETGTKPIDSFNIIMDHDPQDYFVINDKFFTKYTTKPPNGSIWRMDGKQYAMDEQQNWYIFRRLDNVHG